jgi:photosystem II stability/assembly factor-like uncharacterized protein
MTHRAWFVVAALGPAAGCGWAVGKKINHTSDGGATWTVQTTPHIGFNGVAFADASVGWVAGDGGVILKTVTGGK